MNLPLLQVNELCRLVERPGEPDPRQGGSEAPGLALESPQRNPVKVADLREAPAILQASQEAAGLAGECQSAQLQDIVQRIMFVLKLPLVDEARMVVIGGLKVLEQDRNGALASPLLGRNQPRRDLDEPERPGRGLALTGAPNGVGRDRSQIRT